jgi:LmbE family N-acetylglucosaminyl deacetylase
MEALFDHPCLGSAAGPRPGDRAGLDHDAHRAVEHLGSVLTVWAHPDDETYLAGGLMAALAALGRPVTCVTATLGERGGPVDQQAETAWRRAEELTEALGALGVSDHVLLGLPDGGCSAADPSRPVRAIAELLASRRPDTVVTFGPDGLTGHPDHQAVSRWVSAAVLLHPGPRPRLLHVTETPDQVARSGGIDGVYAPGLPRTHRPDQLALQLRLGGALLDAKVDALHAHASQTRALEAQVGASRYRAWVADESFVAAPAPLGHRPAGQAA